MDLGSTPVDTRLRVQAGQVVAERFEIEGFAGSGGMGSVYRALDRFTGHPVALKVLRARGGLEVERFAREAQVLAELSHPAIVRFVAHGRTLDDEPYLALEWIDGENLADRLARAGLTVAESLILGARVAEALGAAHRRGVVHRDVKPSNLLLAGGRVEDVKVVDFGIARTGSGDRTLTQTGAMIGTPGYMAPEQARGEKRVDARVDVFALGCVLFRCLTGKKPFDADDAMATLLKLVLEDAPRLGDFCSEAPPELEALVARMLTKDPAGRPADGAEVARAIEAIERRDGGRAAPASESASALTTIERPVMCVVLAKTAELAAEETAGATVAMPDHRRRSLGGALEPYGGSLAILADRSLLVTVESTGAFTDQAARAARCALEVRKRYPDASIAVVAGRGDRASRLPMGTVIDRAVDLLRRAPPGTLRVDDVVAGMLTTSFELGGDSDGLYLVSERVAEGRRTLLGRTTPFVGRDRELALLESVFDEVVADQVARAAITTAPAGIGKSRLRIELIRRIRERAVTESDEPQADKTFELWLGRGDPMRAGSPFGVLAPAIRASAGVLDGEPIEVRRQKLKARVGRSLAGRDRERVAMFLGELAGVPFPDDESVELAAARRDAMLMGDQMRRAFEDFVAAACASAPQMIVIEDLQWGDRPSLQFLDAALRNLHDRPLLVLAFGRPEIDELFPGLWAGRAVTELKLAPLGRKASEKLVRRMLGDDLDAETIDRIVALSCGDAFYLEELIRAVAEGKGSALPETVLAMVQERLDGLDAETRRVLRAASVFGRVFWSGGVTALLGGDEKKTPAIADRLDDLATRELVQRIPVAKFPGQDEYAFRHSLVREAAYAMLTDTDRTLGHRLAGAWMERAGESDPAALGEHFERGGELARAFAAYHRAAAQALEGNDFTAAVSWADRALRCTSPGDEVVGAVRLIQAEALRWQDELARAEPYAAEAKARLSPGSPPWFVATGELASLASRLGRTDALVTLGEELRDRWSPDAGAAQIMATAGMSTFLVQRAAYTLADDLLAKVQAIEPGARYPFARAKIHQAVAMRALVQGDPGRHLSYTEAAATLFAEAGDRRNESLARITLGFSHADLGDFGPAEQALREALALASRMGLLSLIAYARHTLGITLARAGALEEARALETTAAESFAAHGDARLEGGSRAYLAMILAKLDDLEGAEREATAAVDGLGSAPPVRAYALATRARIRLANEEPERALADALEAMRMLEQLGGIEEGDALVRLAHAEALYATGDREGARAAIEGAKARVIARAEKLGDAIRARFLENVEENARTIALDAEWRTDDPPDDR